MTGLPVSRKVCHALFVCASIVSVVTFYVITRNYASVRGYLADNVCMDLQNVACQRETTMRVLEPLILDPDESVAGQSAVQFKGKGMMGKELVMSQVAVKMAVGGKQWLALRETMLEAENAAFPWKPYRQEQIDCSRLFLNSTEEQEKATRLQTLLPPMLPPTNITSLAVDCKSFKQNFGFITSSLTQEEEEFPIAFSILLFKDVEQMLNLLRAIYRPQNYYCLHVDLKSSPEDREAVNAITGCFSNVFLSSVSVDVQWGKFTNLEPEIICMQDLWKYKWKYFINLTGQEFPLRTNWELVQILKTFNGANSLEGTWKRRIEQRYANAGAPPPGLNLTHGAVHVTVNRDFVDFILHNQLAKDFLNWSRKVEHPDEVFFTTLNHNPQLGIRGAYLGEPETHPDKYPFVTRFKNWGGFPFDYPCAGKRVRLLCIFTIGDLPLLASRPELFANKFHSDYSQVALGCMAERIYNNTREEFLGRKHFDLSYYQNLDFVKNMVQESTFNRTLQSPF